MRHWVLHWSQSTAKRKNNMPRLSIGLCLILASIISLADPLPETNISYTIEVQLVPKTRDLDGQLTVSWRNTLKRPVESIPMHLYLNAFSHQGTSWYRTTKSSVSRTVQR